MPMITNHASDAKEKTLALFNAGGVLTAPMVARKLAISTASATSLLNQLLSEKQIRLATTPRSGKVRTVGGLLAYTLP